MSESPPPDIVPLAEALYKGAAADPRTFGPRAAELVQRARREGPVEAVVVGLRAHAEAQRLSLHNAAAKVLLDEAVGLAERHGLDRRLGELLVTRVPVQHELGNLAAAQHDADRAAALLPVTARADVLFQQAVLLQNVGRLAAAAAQYRRLLADPECPVVVQAKAGNNLAHLESELGHLPRALALLDVAEQAAVRAGPTLRAYVAQTRAFVEVQSGRLSQSLARFEAAHELFEAAGLSLGGHHLEYADALAGLRLLPEALEAAERGLAALPEDQAPLMTAEAYLRVARLSLLAGDGAGAREAAGRGAHLLRRQRRTGWVARITVVSYETQAADGRLGPGGLRGLRRCAQELERCGMVGDAVGAFLLAGRSGGPAHDSLRSAERLARRGPVLVRLQGRLARALRAEREQDGAAVLRACQAGLVDLDAHRIALPSMELRARASTYGTELGQVGLRALLPAGVPHRVFAWLERTRAAALAPLQGDHLAGDHLGGDHLGGDQLEGELAALRAAHAELAARREVGEAEPPALLSRIAAAEAAVRKASWSARAAAPGAAALDSGHVSAAQVRAHLGAEVLVEYGELDGTLLAAVLEPRGTRLVQLGSAAAAGREIDALLFALRRLAGGGRPGPARTAALRSATAGLVGLRARLLDPLGIDPDQPLVVVPVGDLQRAPWAPLHDGPTTVAPSAATWLRTLAGRGDRSGPTVLIAGPDLPGAAAEVALLARLHPGATALAPAQATCAASVAALTGSGLAHLACHGRLRADNPAFSALQLTDGPLSVHELSLRGGAPRRVVLAACESGAQVALPGDEALGFVSALLSRGSAGVVASGVLVPDGAALPVMHELHRGLAAGATLAGALHTARAALDPTDPLGMATWCAFDAYGAA